MTTTQPHAPGLDRDGHVTGLGFDRLLYGEPHEAAAVSAHVAACEKCGAVLAQMRADDADLMIPLPPLPKKAELASRPRSVRTDATVHPNRSRVPKVAAAVGGFLALAAAALFLIRPFEPAVGDDPKDAFRTRGGAAIDLTVHVYDGELSRTVQPGATVAPGDKARFEILLGRGGFVMVVGMDDSAEPYACWPQEEDPAAVYLPQSNAPVVLPTAIEFDESPGREHIFALWCDHPFHLGDLTPTMTAELFASTATAPPGCSLSRVDLVKAAH